MISGFSVERDPTPASYWQVRFPSGLSVWHELARMARVARISKDSPIQRKTVESGIRPHELARVGTSGTNGTSWVRTYQLPVGPNPCPASRHPIHRPHAIIFRPFASLPKSSTTKISLRPPLFPPLFMQMNLSCLYRQSDHLVRMSCRT